MSAAIPMGLHGVVPVGRGLNLGERWSVPCPCASTSTTGGWHPWQGPAAARKWHGALGRGGISVHSNECCRVTLDYSSTRLSGVLCSHQDRFDVWVLGWCRGVV